jgi:hypothetical protein
MVLYVIPHFSSRVHWALSWYSSPELYNSDYLKYMTDMKDYLISNHDHMRSLILHYDSGITPSLFIATILGIHWVNVLFKHFKVLRKFQHFVTPIMTFSLIACAIIAM